MTKTMLVYQRHRDEDVEQVMRFQGNIDLCLNRAYPWLTIDLTLSEYRENINPRS
jgi:hypothetical protein